MTGVSDNVQLKEQSSSLTANFTTILRLAIILTFGTLCQAYTGFEPWCDFVFGSSDSLYDKRNRELNNRVKEKIGELFASAK